MTIEVEEISRFAARSSTGQQWGDGVPAVLFVLTETFATNAPSPRDD